MTRGTSNKNVSGNSEDRRRRKVYLVEHYRADVDGHVWRSLTDETQIIDIFPVPLGEGEPVCRCYRCGCLLTVETVTADRRVPGCEGGTYKRDNLRPACGTCNSSTGGRLGARRRITNPPIKENA